MNLKEIRTVMDEVTRIRKGEKRKHYFKRVDKEFREAYEKIGVLDQYDSETLSNFMDGYSCYIDELKYSDQCIECCKYTSTFKGAKIDDQGWEYGYFYVYLICPKCQKKH